MPGSKALTGTKSRVYDSLMKRIALSNTGNHALIDDDNYEKVTAFGRWYESDTGYAVKRGKVYGKSSTIRLHRVIAEPPKGLEVDHVNGNRLDNRRSNLRIVSHAINAWNTAQNKTRKYNKGLPTGIAWDNTRGKYIATRILRKRFDTLEEAVEFQKQSELYDYENRRMRPELPTGVAQLKGSKRFTAKFVYKTNKYYLGTFNTPQEAEEALINRKKEICQ